MEKVAEHINEMQRIHEEYGAIFDHLFRQHQKSSKQVLNCCLVLCIFSSSVSILCLCVQKWTQTDTKVTFHPPTQPAHPTRPPENFFWSQMKGMAKIRLFYSNALAFILPR